MNRKGFTLIELMIVVAIIGILAAIAIPSFLAMQLRAKRSELPTNLDAIRTAEKAYHAEWDQYLSVPLCPAAEPRREPIDLEGACATDWAELGWSPDGIGLCRYQVVAFNSGDWATSDFEATAECDIDGDGNYALFRASKDERSAMVTGNNVY